MSFSKTSIDCHWLSIRVPFVSFLLLEHPRHGKKSSVASWVLWRQGLTWRDLFEVVARPKRGGRRQRIYVWYEKGTKGKELDKSYSFKKHPVNSINNCNHVYFQPPKKTQWWLVCWKLQWTKDHHVVTLYVCTFPQPVRSLPMRRSQISGL